MSNLALGARKRSRVGTARRRRGPRFTDEDKEATARRIQQAAVRLITERGLQGFSLRALGTELDISGTAPLHYFGSARGLLGAVAAHGFDELADRLGHVRESQPPGPFNIRQLSIEYARFALENQHLYRAMHAKEFWHSSASSDATERAQIWVTSANGARTRAFNEFRLALGDDTLGEQGRDAEASLRSDDLFEHRGSPSTEEGSTSPLQFSESTSKPLSGHERIVSCDLAAHAVTALTDGFLFQIFEENVGVIRTTEGRLAYLRTLVDLTLAGIIPSLQR